ncbi:MAG: hypothetical protein AB7G12_08815 [Thermoanaerobaculia bacterium]
MAMRFGYGSALAAGAALFLLVPGGTRAQEPVEISAEEPAQRELKVDFGIEAKIHYRDSEQLRFPSPFPFPESFLPPGATQGFLETVDEGGHFEVSVVTLLADATWGPHLVAHAKIDVIDLYDRNPTSSDREIDVDEIWIRFGRDPHLPEDGFGAYAKVGKFEHFERQNDRHLESYGLISTAFNRFEDQGVELGFDFGRHLYLRGSLTQGNPLFFRDPNALAGDNGTPKKDPFVHPNPVPELMTGFPILYDAEVEDLDVDGDLETGVGLGIRFGDRDSGRALDLLAWGYQRKLADTVALHGTFYGGDLDLLRGPLSTPTSAPFSLPISDDDKKEYGGNAWLYLGGFTAFGQYVSQEVAGLDRTGYELELAWKIELPLAWAVGGRQLFPSLQPAIRYSHLKPEFAGGSAAYPSPSVRWEWDKLDYGLRIGIITGVDLTIEFADNEMTLANGRKISNDELLSTLRFRM